MARKRKPQKKRRHKAGRTLLLVLLLLVIVSGGVYVYIFWLSDVKTTLPLDFQVSGHFPGKLKITDNQVQDSFAKDLCVSASGSVPLEGISQDPSQYGGLFDLDGRRVLYGQNIYDKLYPASITKIMTAIIALKYGNLSDVVTVSQEALILEEGSQLCGLRPGDSLTLEHLLYGLLVYSGNDAGAAIAEHVGGTQENFVQMMNEEVSRLGMTNTHFVNPHGLQSTEHYTSI